MISFFNKIKEHTFVLHVITLMSGTALSQGIMFGATPFLTRIYNAEEFGVFSLYLAIIGPLSIISSWRYESAILLPESEEDARALLYLSIFITFLMSLFIFIFIFIFKDMINSLMTDEFSTFLWIVPLGVFISGLYQIMSSWNSRYEFYRHLSKSVVLRSTIAVSTQISFKTLLNLSGGLVWGNLIASTIATFYLIRKAIIMNTIVLANISTDKMKQNAKDYDKFPKYQSFASLINALSTNAPVVLLSTFYSLEIAGYYALTNRVLMAPVSLISGSIRNVYYQKAAKIFSKGESIRELFLKTTFNLFKIGIVPFLLIAIFAKPIFYSLFGTSWGISAVFYQLLFAWSIMLFINPPSTTTVLILGLQKFSLNFTIISLLTRILALYLGYILYNDFYVSIGLYALVGVLLNIFLLLYILKKIPS